VKSLPFVAESVDAYISAFPEPTRTTLEDIRHAIREAAPDAVEKINYDIPLFYLKGKLVHFAAYKKHIGFHPGPSAVVKFRDRLAAYRTSNGTIQFALSEPVPVDLIKEIIRFKVEVNIEQDRMK
jgi:uncharacterized protein YdhG (YjbR/CyaY superfamily)